MDFETNGIKVSVSPAELTNEQLTGLAQEVAEAACARNLELPAFLAGGLAVEASAAPTTSPETPDPEALAITAESLLATFDTAYQGYGLLVRAANGARVEAKGRKKPEQLAAVDAKTIRADVETILASPDVVAELQAELDRARAYPETDSPEPGFRLMIVPESLAESDEQAIAADLQLQLKNQLGVDYKTPYIRPAQYNDKRTPAVSGKGYRIAFAPTHYNVPGGTASTQTKWMDGRNQSLSATELQTATDAEAMQFISQLLADSQLPVGRDYNPARYHATYFRRVDQAPVGGRVSGVCVDGCGWLDLDGSNVHVDNPTRALVVPKA